MKKIKQRLLFMYDWSISVDSDLVSIKHLLRSEFYKTRKLNGVVNFRSFNMFVSMYPGLYDINLVGFHGKITETKTASRIDLSCRFASLFLYMYWLAAFSISFGILFNIGEQDQLLQYMPDKLWIAITIPIIVYVLLLLFYLTQLGIGKQAILKLLSNNRKEKTSHNNGEHS